MIIIFTLLFVSFLTYLIVGSYVILKDRKSPLNRAFFMLNLSFAIYALGSAFMLIAPTEVISHAWNNIMFVGAFSFSCLLLHFSLIYSGKKELLKKWWIYIIIYLPFVVFIFLQLTNDVFVKEFVHTKYGWIQIDRSDSIVFWVFNAQYIVYCSLAVLLAIRKWIKATSHTEKKQAKIISISALSTLILGSLLYIWSTINSNIPSLIPIGIVIWSLGILYGIVKYKLMVITPALAAEQILQTISESVVLVSAHGEIISVNRETKELLGYTESDLIGNPIGMIFSNDEKFKTDNIEALLNRCPIKNMETHFVDNSLKEIPVVFSASEFRNDEGDLLGYITATRDITNLKKAEERLRYLAHHDSLTSLPNRLLFADHFNQETLRAQRNKTYIAVLMLDIDHFKEVNDSLGHTAGDLLLVEVANRLKSSTRNCDSVARLGGDEFVVLLGDLGKPNDYKPTVKRIMKNISEPFFIDNNEINITISVGISIYQENGTELDDLLKESDIAMYFVKNSGRNNFKLITPDMDTTINTVD